MGAPVEDASELGSMPDEGDEDEEGVAKEWFADPPAVAGVGVAERSVKTELDGVRALLLLLLLPPRAPSLISARAVVVMIIVSSIDVLTRQTSL